MGKLIKRPVKSQILGSSSFLKTRSNNPFGFKTTSDIFAPPLGSTIYTVATGGVITQVGDYKVHTFNSSANFVVSTLGTDNTVEYLVVAGGGGGGILISAGGGAGGLLTATGLSISVQSYPVVIGSGGGGSTVRTSRGASGVNSSFNAIVSTGGGGGGSDNDGFYNAAIVVGANGGSGGGNSYPGQIAVGGLGIVGQGRNGGGTSSGSVAGGGGGAGAIGANGVGSISGTGGIGLQNSITGTTTYYAGGGGGGSYAGTAGVGGTGGGGNGTNNASAGLPGTVNTGGGGGGSGYNGGFAKGGNGGSGIVIIKYKSPAGPYSVNAQAYFTQVTANGGSLTESEKVNINTFIGALGTDFAEFDRLWIHGLSDSVAARTSLVNPTSTMITAVNSPTFTASQGYTGNDVNSYLESNFNPSIGTNKYTRNSCSFGVYSLTNTNELAIDIGLYDGNFSQLRLREGGLAYVSINDAGATQSITNASSTSLFSAVRTSSTTNNIYRAGSLLSNYTVASSGLPNISFYMLARHNNYGGGSSDFSSRKISASFIGSGIINQANFYTAIQTLGTSIGWAV